MRLQVVFLKSRSPILKSKSQVNSNFKITEVGEAVFQCVCEHLPKPSGSKVMFGKIKRPGTSSTEWE